MSLRSRMRYMNPYDIHKAVINEYVLQKPGDTKFLRRDTSGDKTDSDVIREHHRFLWSDGETAETWEEEFARRYYDKLFKEYCIADLSRYKDNKIALRWRIEREVVDGKGQFTCGNKICDADEDLKSWEINFAYIEKGEKKNALVKIRLCPSCSKKLNYRSKKREVKRLKRRGKTIKNRHVNDKERIEEDVKEDGSNDEEVCTPKSGEKSTAEESPWENLKPPAEIKSRDEEMEDYLQDLLL